MKSKYKFFNFLGMLALASIAPMLVMAQEAASTAAEAAPTTNNFESVRYVLAGFAILLLFVIISLTSAIRAALSLKMKRIREQKIDKKIVGMLLLVMGIFTAPLAMAQEAADAAKAVVEDPNIFERIYNTMPNDVLITILVIIVELAVIFGLVRQQTKLLKEVKPQTALPADAETAATKSTWASFLDRLGANKPDADLESLDLNHDYDGIRELDNNIPTWWQFAFGGTILFAVVYLFRFFISGTMPTQVQELEESQRIADIKIQEYLKNSADNVDENTVTMLDAGGIAQGATLFSTHCVACHGAKGEGGMGPNLTDNYWLHKGSLKDVFYSIKYGWPDKGMKAWQTDLSPMEIAQLASFIESLKGSNPPNAKAPQGDIFEESEAGAAAATDTAAATTTDSTAKN